MGKNYLVVCKETRSEGEANVFQHRCTKFFEVLTPQHFPSFSRLLSISKMRADSKVFSNPNTVKTANAITLETQERIR